MPVEKGELASGLYGDGRMAEPETILQFIADNFFFPGKLTGKKAIVSAGPTYDLLIPFVLLVIIRQERWDLH